jgi:signal transduction histidine kinase
VPAVLDGQTRRVSGAAGHDRRAWTARVVVPALLAGYVAVLYVLTVLVGRAVVGGSTGGGFGLTVLAAAVAALTLEPLGVRLRRRLPLPPQDRLARLASGAMAVADLNQVLEGTARLLQEGLAATSVELQPASAPTILARPATGAGEAAGDVHVVPLEASGTALGWLRVAMPAGTHLSPGDRALLAEVGQHVTTILQTAALRDALRTTVTEAELRTADLRLSRQRIVLTSYEGRRRVERDIHDGAQQHLFALAVHLGLLRSLLAEPPKAALRAIEIARSSAQSAIAALEELSSGLYPARLAEYGLGVALEQAGRTCPLDVVVRAHELPRPDPDAEAAVYFCCLEAMQNAAKHAQASRLDLRLASRDGALTFAVTDDGRGFLPSGATAGAGTQNMRDRVEALGGSLDVTSAPGAGATVSGEVPLAPRLGPPGVAAPRSVSPSSVPPRGGAEG